MGQGWKVIPLYTPSILVEPSRPRLRHSYLALPSLPSLLSKAGKASLRHRFTKITGHGELSGDLLARMFTSIASCQVVQGRG